MRGMPFHLQGKGVLEEVSVSVQVPLSNWKKSRSCGSTEPTSVLDTRRSPSPPNSTSTLSSSFGGGSVADSAGMAAVSDNPPHKWPPSQDSSSAAAAAGLAASETGSGSSSGGSRKEEWASELQPIPASLEEKCSLGMEDWENMLSESTSSPSNEQSFFRWFMGDVDDPSLKQLLQNSGPIGGSLELEGGVGPGFGVVDPGFGFEPVSNPANAFAIPIPSAAGADFAANRLISIQNPTHFGTSPNPLSLPPNLIFQQQQQVDFIDEKPQLLGTQNLQNHFQNQMANPQQNPALFLPMSFPQQENHHLLLPPQPKRHQPNHISDAGFQIPKASFCDSGQEHFLQQRQQQPQLQQQRFCNLNLLQQRPAKPKAMGVGEESNMQQQAFVDQLFKAAELAENGNSILARGILARLNHQLSPFGKPLLRAAFYFKEALQLLVNKSNSLTSSASPMDVVFKINAYKVFSEVSPFIQFVNFTSNQVLLEALDNVDRIHIVDFDIGLGGQWASFMQELALRLGGAPSLRITAFASPSTNNSLELGLTRENLSHFASDLGIPFEFNVINVDSMELSNTLPLPLAMLNLAENEAVAVNLPAGSFAPSTTSILRLVKQLSPKIVVSVDSGCDRSELPFPHYFLNALHSYSVLLDSLDALNLNSDAVQKIERFLLSPRIENIVLGRHRLAEKLPPWRALFASAGFSPLSFTNFTEMQAECLAKRLPVRGFYIEKRQASLCLCWQRGELVSVSAWRC